MTTPRPSRRGPDVWPALLNAVRRAVADGATCYADVYAAVPYHPGHVRRAVGELVRRGEVTVTGGTRPVRIALAEPQPPVAA